MGGYGDHCIKPGSTSDALIRIQKEIEMATKLEVVQNGTVRQINAYFRANDDSHKWPICNKFNATERAIRRIRKLQLYSGGLEYFHVLETEII